MTTGARVRATSLLGLPVRTRGIALGRVHDVVLDVRSLALVGFDVASRDGPRRFLPRAAARIRQPQIEVASALLLLEETEAAFYRRRTRAFAALVGATVDWTRGRSVLVDVLFDASGTPSVLVVRHDGRETDVPLSDVVAVGGDRPTRAA